MVRFGRDVHDVEGIYARWFAELGVHAVAVRPDLYVFGASTDPAALTEELLTTLRPSVPTLTPR